MEASDAAMATVLRRRRFKVQAATDDEATFTYGDRNRYFKMATLLTHLGLILFLVGGAVTGAFGFETAVFVGEAQTAPVQPVGTPGNLLLKNLGFEAPTRADGSFADFRTDLAVYRDGQEIARKTIRVNDPLTVDGFVFHQNSFGAAETLAYPRRRRQARLVRARAHGLAVAGQATGLPDHPGFAARPVRHPRSRPGGGRTADRRRHGRLARRIRQHPARRSPTRSAWAARPTRARRLATR